MEMETEKKSNGNGALLGLVIIIIILVIGGIYIWQSKVITEKKPIQIETVTTQDAAVLDALELDLQNTDTSTGVDANTIN